MQRKRTKCNIVTSAATDLQENTWARLRDSRPGACARFTQPSPHIVLHFCSSLTCQLFHSSKSIGDWTDSARRSLLDTLGTPSSYCTIDCPSDGRRITEDYVDEIVIALSVAQISVSTSRFPIAERGEDDNISRINRHAMSVR